MKTWILNGSPRKDGNTAYLIEQLVRRLDGESKIFFAYDSVASPCMDCRYCWNHDGCSLDDEMQEVYKEIEASDNIVLASPIQFMGLSAPLLCVASRFQRYYAARKFRKTEPFAMPKKGAFILTAGGDGGAKYAGAVARLILREVGANCLSYAMSLRTDVLPSRNDQKVLEEIGKMAKILNVA